MKERWKNEGWRSRVKKVSECSRCNGRRKKKLEKRTTRTETPKINNVMRLTVRKGQRRKKHRVRVNERWRGRRRACVFGGNNPTHPGMTSGSESTVHFGQTNATCQHNTTKTLSTYYYYYYPALTFNR